MAKKKAREELLKKIAEYRREARRQLSDEEEFEKELDEAVNNAEEEPAKEAVKPKKQEPAKQEPAKKEPKPKQEPVKQEPKKQEPAKPEPKKPEPKQEPVPAVQPVVQPVSVMDAFMHPDGPGKAYCYYDFDDCGYHLISDIWAVQMLSSRWMPVWVYYKDGRIDHVLTKDEIKKYIK
ncbi:hypothetical protein IJ076_00465 [Candidatus Saccharibacteria bacterium]|nr:hypothetical protein [Candidatus Saccharibacteria bacterium]